MGSIKVRSNNERSKSLRGPNFLKSLIRWITSESIVVALPGALEMRQFYSLSSGALFIRTLWATPKFSFLLPLLKIYHFFRTKNFFKPLQSQAKRETNCRRNSRDLEWRKIEKTLWIWPFWYQTGQNARKSQSKRNFIKTSRKRYFLTLEVII